MVREQREIFERGAVLGARQPVLRDGRGPAGEAIGAAPDIAERQKDRGAVNHRGARPRMADLDLAELVGMRPCRALRDKRERGGEKDAAAHRRIMRKGRAGGSCASGAQQTPQAERPGEHSGHRLAEDLALAAPGEIRGLPPPPPPPPPPPRPPPPLHHPPPPPHL